MPIFDHFQLLIEGKEFVFEPSLFESYFHAVVYSFCQSILIYDKI